MTAPRRPARHRPAAPRARTQHLNALVRSLPSPVCYPRVPAWARAQAARIQSPEVYRHFQRGEARTLDLRPALRNVRCPTLVIVGEHDPLVPASLAQEIITAIPGSLGRLEVIPRAAHTVETDNPAATFDVIRGFAASLPTSHHARRSRPIT